MEQQRKHWIIRKSMTMYFNLVHAKIMCYSSNITEITLPQNVLLQSVAGSSESDDGEEENILMVGLHVNDIIFNFVDQGLSIKLQESKSFKNISAASFSPNRRYVAIGVTGEKATLSISIILVYHFIFC